MSLKLCKCGTCETATIRAIALVKQMVVDRECPTFMIAVAHAMDSLAFNIACAAADSGVPPGTPKMIKEMVAIAAVSHLRDGTKSDMESEITDNEDRYLKEIRGLCDVHNKMVDEERNLPKDP